MLFFCIAFLLYGTLPAVATTGTMCVHLGFLSTLEKDIVTLLTLKGEIAVEAQAFSCRDSRASFFAPMHISNYSTTLPKEDPLYIQSCAPETPLE